MIGLIILLLILTPYLALAQSGYFIKPGVLPDSKIYWLDLWGEEVRYFFTYGEVNKADYKIRLAKERLSELKVMYERGVTKYTDMLLTRYEKEILQAQELYSSAKIDSVEKIKELQNYTEEQIILNEGDIKSYLVNTVPDEYDTAVNQTMGAIGYGFQQLLIHLEQKNKEIQQKKADLGVQ